MKNVTVILIGTVHDTIEETKIFGILHELINNKPKNAHWLCEGESYNRNCTSIKDNKIHLITDSLFVNMMILDYENNKTDPEFMDILYGRIIELFVTISKFDNIVSIVKDQYQKIIKLPIDQMYINLQNILVNDLVNDMRKLVFGILIFMQQNDMIPKQYEKCVFDFYGTGIKCEDTILTVLREESFLKMILEMVNGLDGNKHYVIVTVGLDHCIPLSLILEKFNIKTKIVKFV
jgi:hypothetical protein